MTEPTAWVFELAGARVWEGGKPTGWTDWAPPQLSFTKPCVPEGSIRNLRPLVAVAAPEVDEDTLNDARAILASGLFHNKELPGTHEALISPGELDPLESVAVHAIAALLARADTAEPVA